MEAASCRGSRRRRARRADRRERTPARARRRRAAAATATIAPPTSPNSEARFTEDPREQPSIFSPPRGRSRRGDASGVLGGGWRAREPGGDGGAPRRAPPGRLHVAVSRRLSRRLGEVDASEVAALCRAADTVDDSAVREAMLDVVCASAGAGRNGMFAVGGARMASRREGRRRRRRRTLGGGGGGDGTTSAKRRREGTAVGGERHRRGWVHPRGGDGVGRRGGAPRDSRRRWRAARRRGTGDARGDGTGTRARADGAPSRGRRRGRCRGAAAGDDATRAAMRRPAYAALLSGAR